MTCNNYKSRPSSLVAVQVPSICYNITLTNSSYCPHQSFDSTVRTSRYEGDIVDRWVVLSHDDPVLMILMRTLRQVGGRVSRWPSLDDLDEDTEAVVLDSISTRIHHLGLVLANYNTTTTIIIITTRSQYDSRPRQCNTGRPCLL